MIGHLGCAGSTVIRGEKGCIGATGADGAPGTDGTNGTNGTDGTDGVDGAPGAQGAAGADGGNITYTAGPGISISGTNISLLTTNWGFLPTSAPVGSGNLYNNDGVLTIA